MATPEQPKTVVFPGQVTAVSNVPVGVPKHFTGRAQDVAAIEMALAGRGDRVAIAALHGLRGVGKTVLAAAYAVLSRNNYRATWWVRAESEATLRADLVGLGIRLGWVSAEETEEVAVAMVGNRLRSEADGILLIYDNAIDADAVRPYLPRGGSGCALVTSNSHVWRSLATPIEISLWPKEVGSDFLVARTGQIEESRAATELSEALGGLPLAHEQAAAYCERLKVSLGDYARQFSAEPARLLDTDKDAPAEYRGRLTVAKTFALAIQASIGLHPAAEPLMMYAALLSPEPIPLFLFREASKAFDEPLASLIKGVGLDEAIAALRGLGLITCEEIADERDPQIITAAIRVHRLVREVAAGRHTAATRAAALRVLLEAMVLAYPREVYGDPRAWTRARRLDALAFALVRDGAIPVGGESPASELLDCLASYRNRALADYPSAQRLFERSLAIREQTLGPQHATTAISLNNLAVLHHHQGDFATAQPLYERALAITEAALGEEHEHTAIRLNNLAMLLQNRGNLAAAKPLCERALAIREKTAGPMHPDTAVSLDALAVIVEYQGDLATARVLYERALAINQSAFGEDHPSVSTTLNNLAGLLRTQKDYEAARSFYERGLAIDERVFGPEHPEVATDMNNLAGLLHEQGNIPAAAKYYKSALAIFEKTLGPSHPYTLSVTEKIRYLNAPGA